MMMYITAILQALVLAMPVTCKVIQISPNYDRYSPGSYIVNVPASDFITVPVSKEFANVPTSGTLRVCQDKIISIPNTVQWSPYTNNFQHKISNEVSDILKTTLPYNNDLKSGSRKGLGGTLENIKTQLANLAQFALASYNLIENADAAKSLAGTY